MDAAMICSHGVPYGTAALRPCNRIKANSETALIE
jgi:hypothetical protein